MKPLRILFVTFILASGIFYSSNAMGQCAVCKNSVESSMKSGGKKTGTGLNSGIIALLVMPYIMVGIVGVLWYTNSRKKASGLRRQASENTYS